MPQIRTPYALVPTHDIDALSAVELPLGRTLGGFFYRCLAENLERLLRGHISLAEYGSSILAAVEYFPAKAGLCLDAWARSLGSMLEIERAFRVRSTLFFIPVCAEPGVRPGTGNPAPRNRAAHYRLSEQRGLLSELVRNGWEVGVHGINAWRSLEDARRELLAFREACPEQKPVGVRMHWLYQQPDMWKHLDEAGFSYDSTLGWNDRIGFPQGRYGPFRPYGDKHLAVLPLNIQDGALLSKKPAGLSREEAWREIEKVLDEARANRAVLTVLWHNNSFGPHRFWGELYEELLRRTRADGAEILTAGSAVARFCEGNAAASGQRDS